MRSEAFPSRNNAFRGVCFRNELKRVWFSKRSEAFLCVNGIVLIHTERKHVLSLLLNTAGTSPFVLRNTDPSKLRPQVMDLHVQKRWIVTQSRMREGREKLTARPKEERSQTVSHAQAREHLNLFLISLHTYALKSAVVPCTHTKNDLPKTSFREHRSPEDKPVLFPLKTRSMCVFK